MLDDKLFLEDENNLEDEITLENEMLKRVNKWKRRIMVMSRSEISTKFIESPNHYNGRKGYKICKFTPHHMAGILTAEQCANIFKNPKRNASSNYCIGNNGELVCCVDEENGAWTSSNMVNDFSNIEEFVVWLFVTYDAKNDVYKVNIRSRGPVINKLAAKYNGGGHIYSSGARVKTKEELNNLIVDYDDLCKELFEKQLEVFSIFLVFVNFCKWYTLTI